MDDHPSAVTSARHCGQRSSAWIDHDQVVLAHRREAGALPRPVLGEVGTAGVHAGRRRGRDAVAPDQHQGRAVAVVDVAHGEVHDPLQRVVQVVGLGQASCDLRHALEAGALARVRVELVGRSLPVGHALLPVG